MERYVGRGALPGALTVEYRVSLTPHEKDMIVYALRVEAHEHKALGMSAAKCFAMAHEHLTGLRCMSSWRLGWRRFRLAFLVVRGWYG